MSRGLVLLAASVLVAGCATRTPVPSFDSPSQALVIAEKAEAAGRWGEALATLDAARRRFPGEGRLITQHNDVNERWHELKRLWEDQLAVAQARAALDEIARMEPLATAEPERLWLRIQLSQRESNLKALRNELLDCAERRLDRNIGLAKSCVRLAEKIRSDARSKSLLATIDQRAGARAKKARQRAAQEAAAQRERQIEQAEQRLEERDYAGSAVLIDRVLANDPANQRAQVVRQTLEETITEPNSVLNELAARNYSLQDIDTAIRLWQASLRIRPDQPDIQERLDRALLIKGNLDVLRESKPLQPPADVTQ